MNCILTLIAAALILCCDLPVMASEQTVVLSDKDRTPDMEYKIIPLSGLEFKVVDAVCRPWLSEKGKLTHETKLNSILVYDTPENIYKIKKFIGGNAQEEMNIRIDIESVGGGKTGGTNIGYYSPGKKTVYPARSSFRDGRKLDIKKNKNVEIYVNQTSGSESRLNSSFIVTKSGSPASLWSGKTMVDPSWLRYQKIQPEIVVIGADGNIIELDGTLNDPKWTNVGTSLYVLPRYLGNGMIEVEVYPEISYLTGKGKRQTVKVESLSSRLTVKDGERVPISGVIASKNKQYSNLFGPTFFKSKEISEVMNTYLRATSMKPGQSSRREWIPR